METTILQVLRCSKYIFQTKKQYQKVTTKELRLIYCAWQRFPHFHFLPSLFVFNALLQKAPALRDWFSSRTREQNKDSTWHCPLVAVSFFQSLNAKGSPKGAVALSRPLVNATLDTMGRQVRWIKSLAAPRGRSATSANKHKIHSTEGKKGSTVVSLIHPSDTYSSTLEKHQRVNTSNIHETTSSLRHPQTYRRAER